MTDRSEAANNRKNRLAAALRRNLGERRLQKTRRPPQGPEGADAGNAPVPDSAGEDPTALTVRKTSAVCCRNDNAPKSATLPFERG